MTSKFKLDALGGGAAMGALLNRAMGDADVIDAARIDADTLVVLLVEHQQDRPPVLRSRVIARDPDYAGERQDTHLTNELYSAVQGWCSRREEARHANTHLSLRVETQLTAMGTQIRLSTTVGDPKSELFGVVSTRLESRILHGLADDAAEVFWTITAEPYIGVCDAAGRVTHIALAPVLPYASVVHSYIELHKATPGVTHVLGTTSKHPYAFAANSIHGDRPDELAMCSVTRQYYRPWSSEQFTVLLRRGADSRSASEGNVLTVGGAPVWAGPDVPDRDEYRTAAYPRCIDGHVRTRTLRGVLVALTDGAGVLTVPKKDGFVPDEDE